MRRGIVAQITDAHRVFIVGRNSNPRIWADIHVDDEYVSNQHCKLYYFDRLGHVGVRDLGSINGTFIVRGEGTAKVEVARIRSEALLFRGDRLRLGSYTFVPWGLLLAVQPDEFRVERLVTETISMV